MKDSALLWYANRGTGLALLALLTLALSLGVVSVRARAGGRVPAFFVQVMHRNISLLAVALLVVHIGVAVADEYVDIRWWQSVVPWGLSYKPLALALGVVACDVIGVVVLTSLVRHRMGSRSWKAVHLTAYAAWAMALVHGLTIGTDTGESWAQLTYAGSLAVVVGSAVLRPGAASVPVATVEARR